MTSHVRGRKERLAVVDHDTQIKEVRCQLLEQLKVLDLQLEQKSQQLQDLTEYLRRRGEIESEYSRSLDKLAERFTHKIKRKEPSSNSVAQVWLTLLSQTRQESRDHYGLSESCSTFLIQPLAHCLEYTQQLAKKSKDICTQLQDGLLKVTTELHTAWRTYYQYHSDYLCAELKLKEAEKQEEKQKQSAKKLERLIEKRHSKVQETHLKCSKARNDYLLDLAAANACMNKFYLQDVSTLIDCADIGYHLSLSRVMQAFLTNRWKFHQNLSTGLQQLQGSVSGLDQCRDKDTLLQDHYNTFMPLRFPYLPHDGDHISEVSAECEMRCELETRLKQIQARLKVVTEETEEASQNMSAARSCLMENINDDLELNGNHSGSTGVSCQDGSTENLLRPPVARRRANLQETENLFFTRVREFLVGSSLVSKLQAKHDLLKVAVEEASTRHRPRHSGKSTHLRKNPTSPRSLHNQKLFSGDILSFMQASGQQIPVVVESCIRFINLNGLQHEGIFRVPGPQMEVNSLRDAFERGDDPLAEQNYDLDSVAGVLKLYFRGLENPLFPVDSLSQLLEHGELKNEAEQVAQIKAVVSSFPEPIIVVMRYLFAFLHHVSQYSDENMMQPYNLAVCFGPSLVRGAHDDDDDVVTLQPLINALVKDIIVQHESIFPTQSEVQGPVYEKCMTLKLNECEPVVEEGEVEAEMSSCKVDVKSSADPSISKLPQKKVGRPRANSSGSVDQSRLSCGPAGGSFPSVGQLILQIPAGPPARPLHIHSSSYVHKPLQDNVSPEDAVQVDKVVCRQMEAVFKELLSKQSQLSQRKVRQDGRRGRADQVE